jgi:signal transduction histidine kinase
MKKYLLLLVIGIVGFGVVLYMYAHSESHLARAHKDVLILFLTAKQVDISTDRDLLQARSFLSLNYDPLVDSEAKLEQTCTELHDPKYALYKKSTLEIDKIIDEYCELTDKKIGDIESFKSRQAIFRNSLYYLNKIEADSISHESISHNRKDALSRKLVEASLAYALLSTSDAKRNLTELLEKSAGVADDYFQSIRTHALKIFQTKDQLDELTKSVDQSPAGPLLEKLRLAYFERYETEEVTAIVYRRLLFSTCILFLLFVIYNTASLLRAAQKLAIANTNLELRAVEKDELNKSLEAAVKLANRASEAKSLFLANMSHELRTPMHGILSFARFGQQKIEIATKEKLKSYFDEIHDSGLRLMGLLNNLLDLAKLESGKMTYNLESANLFETIQLVRNEMKAFAEENNRQLVSNGSLDAVHGLFDKDKIGQVVRNLVSNAIKFSEQGSTVKIDVKKINDVLVCSVSNYGVGIPQNELDIIFDSFAQSSRTKSGSGGTGLGLAICKQIVDHHGGRIWAECSESGETKFTFEIVCTRAIAPVAA